MISLCGTCMHVTGAAVRWKRAAPAPLPKTIGPLMSVTREKPCDRCGHMPMAPRFPHAVFEAERSDLQAEKAS